MTQHTQATDLTQRGHALRQLNEIADLRAAIRAEYDCPAVSRDRDRIGALNSDLGVALKLAEAHATLALRDEVERVAGSLDYIADRIGALL